MVNGKPTVISLFAGCGGSSLGYKWAGYHELLAIEWDKNAVETFKLNFPDVPCWQRDIREVAGQEIMDFCGLEPGGLDLLDASPPCQGFSTAGKRKVTDPRNDLFLEFVRLVKELQPKVFVMENVSGLVKGKMKGRFIEIMQTLKGLPYHVRCRKMNAMFYGVPQSRERLIWIGAKDGEPEFPEPNGKTIPFGKIMETGKEDDLDKINRERWTHIPQGGNFSNLPKRLQTKARYSNTYRKLSTRKPAYTLLKHDHFSGAFFHPTESRYITITEKKRIASFPDEFMFTGDNKEITARIGNAVTPRLMEAIATTIRQQMFDKSAQNEQ